MPDKPSTSQTSAGLTSARLAGSCSSAWNWPPTIRWRCASQMRHRRSPSNGTRWASTSQPTVRRSSSAASHSASTPAPSAGGRPSRPASRCACRAGQRLRELRRIAGQRQGHAAVMAGQHRQHQRHVARAATHRPFVGQLLEEHFRRRAVGHAAPRAGNRNVAEARRIAQRAAKVAAVGHRQHARRQCRGRPAACRRRCASGHRDCG